MNKTTLQLALALTLTGCATGTKYKPEQVVRLSCGMTDNEVEALVGAPDGKYKQDDGSEIWEWRYSSLFWVQQLSIRLNKGKLTDLPPTIHGADAQEWRKQVVGCLAKQYPTDIAKAISERKVLIGMTSQQVIKSWGPPEQRNRTVNSNRTHEQWVYPGNRYLYFDNDIMTSFQDSR